MRNYAKEKKGKTIMVVNYKNLIIILFLIAIIVLTRELFPPNRIQGAFYFSKLDCKTRYWQIKVEEQSICLTTFSATQGYYR